MTDRKQNLLILSALLAVLILLYSRILFTDKIIRAPDIINEFFWNVKNISDLSFVDLFRFNLKAGWNYLVNSGYSVEGGDASLSFLIWKQLIFWTIPAPVSVAWFIVLHLFFGAAGVFFCCRAIGASRFAAFTGALIFALAPENSSLINAGHVMKIATISYAPWAFYFLERGFQSRRVIFFLTTALVLAFQFFNTHWQIAFYTCLCVGAYGVCRLIGIYSSEGAEGKKLLPRLLGMNVVLLVFFLTTVSISLLPLSNWSKDTNRGVQSGANQSSGGIQGGLSVDEAMSWSLPPEELGAFIIPGLFGLSRQEAGPNPANITSYYWGRMNFTQTVSYMGLLPWLLLPLPLIFRRDRYTWLSLGGIVGGILFSMGKYTPFYWLLYKFFPGINHFRVPKMMMFIPVLGLAILAARGLDLLRDEDVRKAKAFTRYLFGVCAVPVVLLVMLVVEIVGANHWVNTFVEALSQPTRYEQGAFLIGQRWGNVVRETAIAAGLSALIAAVMLMMKKPRLMQIVPYLLLILFIADTWRVNDKFLFLTTAPVKVKEGEVPPLMKFLAASPKTYRVLPVSGDPMQFASQQIPVLFTSNPVQQRRWQEFLDAFTFTSRMTDMLNVKYFVYGTDQYAQEKGQLGDKYQPVFQSPDGTQLVLENKTVLTKAWLVPAASQINDLQQTLAILQNPEFDPRKVALVESPPPFPMADPHGGALFPPDSAIVNTYEGEKITVTAKVPQNAILVLGEKYYRGWKASVDGKPAEIYPVNHILRGVYLPPGNHTVEFIFDPLPFKIGKWLTLASFALFAGMLVREWFIRRKRDEG